jgi:toxin-antitoxin system PIN domain toxin
LILIDANLLLYAYHPRVALHAPSREWLESVLSGTELVRFAWVTLWAFLRIGTSPKIFEHPLTVAEAETIVTSWLDRANAGIIEPGDRHWPIVGGLMRDGQTTGPLVMDAALAAIALEHGATLCTTDRDFSRFPGLKWTNPLEAVR